MTHNGAYAAQSIGIEVHGGRAIALIPAGSRLPAARAMTFTTIADGQGAVEVRVVRCTAAERPAGVVGRFLVAGLRQGPGGAARIDIGISLDREGVVRAWGVDLQTGSRQEAAFSGLWALAPRSRPLRPPRSPAAEERDGPFLAAPGGESAGRRGPTLKPPPAV